MVGIYGFDDEGGQPVGGLAGSFVSKSFHWRPSWLLVHDFENVGKSDGK
jgi:hypothetical protein